MDARLSYRAASAQGASPLQLVVLLYEQGIEDLRRAVAALQRGDIETRTRELNHALVVIGHLQASLDLEQGAQVARNLQKFYQILRTSLVRAHEKQSASILQEQIAYLLLMREAWIEVERSSISPAALPDQPGPLPAALRDAPHPRSEWNA